MDLVQAFIFDLGWVFFAAWAMVLAAVGVIAFGSDIAGFAQRQNREKPPQVYR